MSSNLNSEVLLSVIMPVYNEAETLDTMIHRVLKDIPHNLELIIIDDGSTDGSGAIADACAGSDSRVHVIHHLKSAAAPSLSFRMRMRNMILRKSIRSSNPS